MKRTGLASSAAATQRMRPVNFADGEAGRSSPRVLRLFEGDNRHVTATVLGIDARGHGFVGRTIDDR